MHGENKADNSGNESAINFEREGPPASSKNSDSVPEVIEYLYSIIYLIFLNHPL